MPIGLEKNCKDCGQEGKGMNTKICNSCSGIDNPSNWIPIPSPVKGPYPEPDESKWPSKAKLSNGNLNLDKMMEALNTMGKTLFPKHMIETLTLGEITSDGERGYICTHCGKIVTQAHHIKPECYKVIYKGQTFYMEKHICDDCMKEFNKEA
jgi:hypothetical protein